MTAGEPLLGSGELRAKDWIRAEPTEICEKGIQEHLDRTHRGPR
jgi:hypothetical protein